MKEKAVVLLSSGLDSSYNLYVAKEVFDIRLVLTFDYGQKAARKEREKAKHLTEKLNLPHKIIELSWFKEFQSSSLISQSTKPPMGDQVSIDDQQVSLKTAHSVWVPNRNGIFLNIAAGFAESLGAKYIVPGFNKEEAATFPDNSTAFMSALDHSFSFSTANHVQVKCFSDGMNKTEIARKAKEKGLLFKDLWPCYFAEAKWCGQCESCQRFQRALGDAGLIQEIA